MSSKDLSFSLEFIAGWVGGIHCLLVGQPFDITKVHIQSGVYPSSGSGSDGLACFKHLIRQEGITGLYKGTLAPLLTVGTIGAIQFSTQEKTRSLLLESSNTHSKSEKYLAAFIGGIASAITSSPVVTIADHSKIKMQIQNSYSSSNRIPSPLNKMLYTSSLEVIWKNQQKYGIASGVFHGYCATLAQLTVSLGFYFMNYQLVKEYLSNKVISIKNNPLSSRKYQLTNSEMSIVNFVSGGISGAFSWFACFPLDTLKTRVQSENLDQKHVTNWRGHFAKVKASQGGFRSLYKGVSISIYRAFCANGCSFLAYEQSRGYLLGLQNQSSSQMIEFNMNELNFQ